MSTLKRPLRGSWRRRPDFIFRGLRSEVWERKDLRVLSSLEPMEAPDVGGSGVGGGGGERSDA